MEKGPKIPEKWQPVTFFWDRDQIHPSASWKLAQESNKIIGLGARESNQDSNTDSSITGYVLGRVN